jgi:pyruvate kinase
VRNEQTADKLWVSYQKLHSTVTVGSRILLDDGAVEVVVEGKGASHGEVICRVKNQGMIGNKKGEWTLLNNLLVVRARRGVARHAPESSGHCCYLL